MKQLRYSFNKDGTVGACGYKKLDFLVDKNTPFQTIDESLNWKKEDGKWIKYDSTWSFDQFDVQVTIDQTNILDNDNYIALIGHVKDLIQSGRAEMETIEGNRIMYFIKLLPAHENLLKQDKKVRIKIKR